MSHKVYAVITADIVGSRKIHDFRKLRDRKLAPLSKMHLREQFILAEYAVTAWDEFQTILRRPEFFPQVILDLRRYFFPIELWIAVGIGTVTEAHKKPVNKFAGGQAFELAREAAESLKEGSNKYRALTSIRTQNGNFELIANTMYHLHDSMIQDVTKRQWDTINSYMRTQRQDLTARELRLDPSTVSRNLKRGNYWLMEENRKAMETAIRSLL